jgi:hypothetical protein
MAPVVYTDWEVVNYNKVDPRNLVTLRESPCYSSANERGTDERFWTFFHQDWYLSVLYNKSKPMVPAQWVHIDYMKSKRDMHFNRILEACEFHGITQLLSFWYNWNQEVITEFYATLFFDKRERIFMWMTNGKRFSIKLSQFVEILGLSDHLAIPKKLCTKRVMAPREMTPMYIPNSGFRAPKVHGILPHFLTLHRMMRRTLAPRIGDSNANPAYEQNLLDALMKHEWFDVFDYIMDDIWNIAINPHQSCGFAPYSQRMIEIVAHEKFYKDAAHEPLRPTIHKDPRTHRTSSPSLVVAPTWTTHSGGASSSSSSNSGSMKMFRSIFTMCCRIDQRLDVIEQSTEIVRRNQEIIHSQQDEPLLEFLDVPIYPPITDPYALLTPIELAAFGIGPSYAPADSDDNDDDDE